MWNNEEGVIAPATFPGTVKSVSEIKQFCGKTKYIGVLALGLSIKW